MVKRMTPHRQLLVEYADSGSEEAFRELVTAYIGLVHGTALRLVDGHQQLAEEVAQTVFTDLARQAKTLSPKIMVGGWLHRRTCHVAATVMRSERRRLVREWEAYQMSSLNSDDALAGVTPVLDEAINQLSTSDLDAIMLRFFERADLRAVGQAMGTTGEAAQKRVERAMEKLRGLLARRGVVLSATALALAVGSASATAAPAGLAATISTAALTSAPAGAGFTLTTLKIITMTKLKITLITAAVALVAVGTTAVVLNRDPSYTPPPNPKMQQILNEAQADAMAGRYQAALAKHIWFRNNALRYEPAMSGVRDSFALMYWAQLAEKYPPAMKKLKSIRDEAITTLHRVDTDPQPATTAYLTAASINNGLKEGTNNVALFKWLDDHNPAAARQVYPVAENDLIAAEEYALCGRYMDAKRSYQQILGMYSRTKDASKRGGRQQLMDFAEKMFSNQSATLVAVLSINNHPDEAEQVASQAARENRSPEFASLLAEAKTGKVPPRWP